MFIAVVTDDGEEDVLEGRLLLDVLDLLRRQQHGRAEGG